MHVAVKCSYIFIFYCKLEIKIKLEDNQLFPVTYKYVFRLW